MKYQIIFTLILSLFSFLLIKNGTYFIKETDNLMKAIKIKEKEYNIKPIDAIITKNLMIPGIKGRKVNINKSYQKMKSINEFKKSLLVFDEIKPSKSINNIYNKIIISGNQSKNKISIILKKDNNYCYTTTINITTICHNKYNIYVEKITNNHLINVKEKVHNGIIFYLENINHNELNLIYKYLINNNYKIVPINNLINE